MLIFILHNSPYRTEKSCPNSLWWCLIENALVNGPAYFELHPIFFGNMKWGLVEVLPDKKFQTQLLAAEVLFWHMVQTKSPPPDFVDFNNFDEQLKEHNNGRQIIPILTRKSES